MYTFHSTSFFFFVSILSSSLTLLYDTVCSSCASGFFSTNYTIFSSGLLYKYPLCISPLNTTKSYIVEKYHIENTSTILLLLTQCFCLFVCFLSPSADRNTHIFSQSKRLMQYSLNHAHMQLCFFRSFSRLVTRRNDANEQFVFVTSLKASFSQVSRKQVRTNKASSIDRPKIVASIYLFLFFFLLSSPFLFPFVSFIPAFAKQYGFECDCTTLKTACPFFVSPFLLCFFFPLKQRLNAHFVANNINFRSYYCTDIYNGRYACISFLSDI